MLTIVAARAAPAPEAPPGPRAAWPGLRAIAALVLLSLLAACSGGGGQWSGRRAYAPPGPASDPWGPYVREAAARFRVPETWIREVMRQESGGHQYIDGQLTTSPAGAMGLMQVMPETYETLREQYGLGDDPYNPHDNILAGTAYIREMYDRYGSPGFLAAYNAGPQRVDQYLATGASLPSETINYLASVAPRLGNDVPMSGPLSAFADDGGSVQPVVAVAAPGTGCDPDAAYDPDRPCAPEAAPVVTAAATPLVAEAAAGECDPDAAYDPSRPCVPPPAVVTQPAPELVALRQPVPSGPCDPDAAYDPSRPCMPMPAAPPAAQFAAAASHAPQPTPFATSSSLGLTPRPQFATSGNLAEPPRPQLAVSTAVTLPPPPRPPAMHLAVLRVPVPSRGGGYAIQVGAFTSPALARTVAAGARASIPDLLGAGYVETMPTTPFGGHLVYRARVAGLAAGSAVGACTRLQAQGLGCMIIPPGG